jgi:cytochrome b561
MTRERYSTVAVTLHWLIALFILMNWPLGWRMQFVKGIDQFTFYQLHKSFGITILLLSVLRLAWRLFRPPPPHAPSLKPWERVAATAVHWGFYVVMIGMPLSGWLAVSTAKLNLPTLLYKTVPWPHVPGTQGLDAGAKAAVNGAADATHSVLAWGALVLFLLHVGAVLKHYVVDKEPVLQRMLPRLRRSPTPSEI